MDIKTPVSSLKEFRAKQLISFGNELLKYIDGLDIEKLFQDEIKRT